MFLLGLLFGTLVPFLSLTSSSPIKFADELRELLDAPDFVIRPTLDANLEERQTAAASIRANRKGLHMSRWFGLGWY